MKSQEQILREFDELLARVAQHVQEGNREAAIGVYKDWLNHNKNSPYTFGVNLNLGSLLMESGYYEEARRCFEISMKVPAFKDLSLHNQALVMERSAPVYKAIEFYRKAESQIQDLGYKIAVINNLALVFERNLRFSEAIACYEKSLSLNPNQPKLIGHLVTDRQKLCQWPIYRELPNVPVEVLKENTAALVTLGITDDPEEQLGSARRSAADITKLVRDQIDVSHYNHGKIRIGYLSSNLSFHAVSILTAELFECHNKDEFEVYAFSWSPNPDCPMLQRIQRAVDVFVPIHELNDAQASELIRNTQIDVLVDLQGLSRGCRPQIFADRVAPIQITYLGFPGSTALPNIDYAIADRYVLPESELAFFQEKPIYMEHCFQVNDRKRLPASEKGRGEFGLPEEKFVFGVFKNPLKLRRDVLDVWMRILNRVSDSVLCLLTYEKETQESLLRYAAERGIGAERIVFTGLVPPDDNFARYRSTDLVLDTYPFNGGTSTSDALWMGVPVLTCSGRSFASRMSGSLLRTAGAPELISNSLADYEEFAVRYATESGTLAAIRERLTQTRDATPLFNTPAFTRELEGKLRDLVKQHRSL